MAADLKTVGTGAQVVGVAAKGATLAGATAAAIPVIGWAAGAVSLAATIFGEKKESSVLQGFEVAGGLSKSGFQGTVVAFDQLGNRWDASGERAGLSKFSAAELITGNANLPSSQADYYASIFGDRVVPVSFKTGADNARLMPQLAGIASTVADSIARDRATEKSAAALLDQLTTATTSIAAPSIVQAEYDRLFSIVDTQHRERYGIPLLSSPDKAGLDAQLAQLRTAAAATPSPGVPVLEAPTLTSDMPAPVIPGSVSITPATGGSPGGGNPVGQPAVASTPPQLDPIVLIAIAAVAYMALARA